MRVLYQKGKTDGWAAGIVYALGRVNFLDDPSQTPHMKSTEIAEPTAPDPSRATER